MSDSRLLRKYRGETCLNCNHPLDVSDKFCAQCGQLNTLKKLKVGDFVREFFASIISYDSRLRNTLTALLFKPGKISEEYIKGKRRSYVNPFRFYLSVSIIFFIIYGFSLNFYAIYYNIRKLDNLSENTSNTFKQELSDVPKEDLAHLDSLGLNKYLKNDTITSYKDIYISEQELDSLSFFTTLDKRLDLYQQFYEDTSITNAALGLDSLKHTKTYYHRYLYHKGVQLSDVTSNLSSVLSYFINKLPIIIFFYLPVFALFVWLLYIRNPFSYAEHIVFLFHIQSLFFVLYSFAFILSYIGVGQIVFYGATLIFFFYLYKAMRRFYKQRRFKTIVKFIIVNFVFLILAFVGAILSFLVSFAIF